METVDAAPLIYPANIWRRPILSHQLLTGMELERIWAICIFIPNTAVAFETRLERQGGDVLTAFGGGEALACFCSCARGDGEHRGVLPASDHSDREGAELGAPGKGRCCLGERRQTFPRTGEAVVQGEQRQESAHQGLSVADHHAEHAVCGRTGLWLERTPVS